MRAGIVAVVLGAGLALPAAAAGQSPQVFRFDGGGYDRAAAITTDGAGNSYVAGSAEAKKGASSFVVVKDGAKRWTARYDGSRGGAGGEARAVAVDGAGNVYAAGSISDGAVFGQNFDYLVVKFGPTESSAGPTATTAPATAATPSRRWSSTAPGTRTSRAPPTVRASTGRR